MFRRRAAPGPAIFYGWWVALGFALIVFLSTGIRFTVGPFLKPIVADLGIDRGSFSLAVSLSLFLYGAFMPLVGQLVDRIGRRLVCAAGAVVIAGYFALTACFSVGSIFGPIFLAHQAGGSLGSWLAGYLFDVTGGYGAAFAGACTLLLLVAAGLSATINTAEGPVARAWQPVAGGK